MRALITRGAVVVGLGLTVACGGTKSSPTAPTTTKTNKVSWFSTLSPGGTSTRSFTVDKAGTLTFTLKQGAGPSLGVGVGLPRNTGGGCRLGFDARTSPGVTSSFKIGRAHV